MLIKKILALTVPISKQHPQSAEAKKGHSIQNTIHLLVQVAVEKAPKFMPLWMD